MASPQEGSLSISTDGRWDQAPYLVGIEQTRQASPSGEAFYCALDRGANAEIRLLEPFQPMPLQIMGCHLTTQPKSRFQ